MIHVCFGLHDGTGRYSKFTGTAMLSLFENLIIPPPSTTVHILHDNTLTNDNRDKFSYLAGRYNQLVEFYNVDELCADKVSKMTELIPTAKTSSLSVAALYRLLIPQLLPADVDKAIYLDSDIIVNLDITKLWQIELGDKILAAVPEIFSYKTVDAMKKTFPLCNDGIVKCEDYFNSGVLIMNLNRLRNEEETLMQGIKFVGEHPQLQFLDQDILNYCFSTQALKLPVKFNRFTKYVRLEKEPLDKKIYHYAGGELKDDLNDPFNRLWVRCFVKTPWFNENTIANLYGRVQNLHIGLKQSMVQLSAVMSGKTRAFFAPPHNVDGLKNFFAIRDDEEIILAENQTSLQKLLDAMNASRGKKVFFIMLPNFPFQLLIQAGFVLNRDFVNGMYFLSEAQGVRFDSYEFVKAM